MVEPVTMSLTLLVLGKLAEDLTTAEYAERFNLRRTLGPDGLVALFDEHCRDEEWREMGDR